MPGCKYTRLYGAVVVTIFVLSLFIYHRAFAAISADRSTAVIFMYQRIGEDQATQGNISLERFREHITELTKAGYSVLPVPKIIDAMKNGDDLPPKTVGITFDGAYQAALANAIPILANARLPFTVFFASDLVEGGNPAHMNWEQIKKLSKNKLVSFGILPALYKHMVNQTDEQNAALINRAVSRYREVMGNPPVLFSYPYGEYNTAIEKQIASYHFKAAFGQQSGVVYQGSNFMALPRFTMTDDYGDLDRFILTANAQPLPVSDVVPEDTMLVKNPPLIGFTVTPEISQLGKLACFGSNLGKLPLTHIGNNRIEIRYSKPFTDRRTRINCTLPNNTVTSGEPRSWRWFGMLLISPVAEEETSDTEVLEDQ